MPDHPLADGGSRSRWGIGTRAVHRPALDPQGGIPVAPLIDLSSTYAFDDPADFADASAAKIGRGYVYTRWANPTVDEFEAAVADLEGADGAEAFATGMAAISAVFFALCRPGDRVVATRQLYGQSHAFLAQRLPSFGIQTTFVDVGDHDAIAAALDGARLLYCETIGNPRVQVADLLALAALAHAAGVQLVVDNTFASPVLCRPLAIGAAAVIHSATKFLGGHHDLMGGVLCGPAEILEPVRSLSRDFGATLSPFNAWLALRGLATLPLRVDRSCSTALAVAQALERRPEIAAAHYPALESSPDRSLAESVLGGRGGGTLAFEVAAGRSAVTAFQERLRLIRPAASLGGTHSLIVHAASITHTQLDPEQLVAAGISEGFCRLSIGLEDPADLIADLSEALDSL